MEHRLVAERKLGRPLTVGEEVHHINRDRTDNREENIHVYASHADHMRDHLTPEEAARRGRIGGWARWAHVGLSDTCAKGHPKTPENTYYRTDHPGKTRCRACRRERLAALKSVADAVLGEPPVPGIRPPRHGESPR